MIKIWQKHLLLEMIKFILFFLLGIYVIYFFIDFSFHGTKIFAKNSVSIGAALVYYYHNFIMYLNLFASLGFMLAVIKVLSSMNHHNELIALFMAGISKYKIASPLFLIALIFSITSFLNFEFLVPTSSKAIELFKNTHLRTKKSETKDSLHTLLLDNSTKLIFQKYDSEKKELFDVFWIISSDDIWHIKYLKPNTKPPMGSFANHFKRENGKLIMQETYESYNFTNINFDKAASASLEPYETRPLSTLYSQYLSNRFSSSKEKAHLFSQLNYKISMPLLPFVIVFALVPICMRFSKTGRIYAITSFSLFGFIGFYSLMDAAVILSENQVGSPLYIIWTPFLLTAIFFIYKFFKV
jgi:lipopolysaccharide export system permease protein